MSEQQTPHEWSHGQFLNKAQRYAEKMLAQDRDSWEFGFWSALALEMLARAAMSSISPTLVADSSKWENLYYALGHDPTSKKFSPRTAATTDILKRLESIMPEFTPEMLNFAVTHSERRNSELHSGSLPFDELGTAKWLPQYYSVMDSLLKFLGCDLAMLFGMDEAKAAKTLIDSLLDEASKAVRASINGHNTVWKEKSEDTREELSVRAKTLASRRIGHRVSCPSCGSTALLHGSSIGSPQTSIEDDQIVERQSMLPTRFECFACELKIAGYSRLSASGLGDSFTSTTYYNAADYFEIEPDYGYEEDFNEY